MPSTERVRLAVAICTRDGERFITEQLESIRGQTRPPDQLILFDDCSNDRTLELAATALREAPFDVQLRRNEQVLGPSANFAAAISTTDADVVALSDQDDVWAPDKLRVLELAFADTRVVATFSDAILVDGAGAPLGGTLWEGFGLRRKALHRATTGQLLEQLVRWNVVTGATLAFRSTLIPAVLPIPTDAPHDAWIALVAALSGQVRALPEPLVRYRLHGRNAVGVPSRDPLAMVATRRNDGDVRLQELHMFQAARERCPNAPNRALQLIAAKEDLLTMRAQLADEALRRMGPVLATAAAGRYHRLAHGWRSAVHDIVFGA